MRIVIGSSSFFREGGGISAYNRELCNILSSAGHDLLVIVSGDGPDRIYSAGKNKPIRVIGTDIPLNFSEQHAIAAKLFEDVIAFDPHVIMSSDHIWLNSLFPCFAERRIRMSVSHFWNGLLAKGAACRAEDTDWIVALSDIGHDWLLKNTFTTKEQLRIIYNTVQDISPEQRIEQKISDNETRIVYPGGGKEQKGADIVLKLLSEVSSFRRFKLIWLGPINFISKFIPENYLSNIHLIGSVSRSEAEKYIRDAHILLLPSRGEGCPMTLLEAMRSGTIPIVSDCPSAMREIVKNGESGFVVKVGDAEGIAKAISRLSANPELRRTLMLNARETYLNMLSPEIWLGKMEEIIQKRRIGRNKGPMTDEFNPQMLIPWHRPHMSWKQPSFEYLTDRLRLLRHAGRCLIISLELRLKYPSK